jgi:ABC-2 type transport system ATP-binding protein
MGSGHLGDTAIRIQGVTKSYAGHVAVRDLTLTVPRGSIFGLLGPNGAGKTTTLRMVMDILGPDSGTIEILGRRCDRATLDRVGYMPEERGLYPRMVLEEQLLFLAEIKGTPRAEARRRLPAWLERMGLTEWARRKVIELSKGMQQKAQLVATLLHEPEVLILDEPMSGLDPLGADLVRGVLLEQRRQGRTVVLSSHQMETVERLCDSIGLINRGEKLLEGPLSEVKSRHAKNTVVLSYDGDGSFLAGLPGVQQVSEFGRYVEVRMAEGADPQALLQAAAARLRLSRFEVVEPSLHDIFVAAVAS